MCFASHRCLFVSYMMQFILFLFESLCVVYAVLHQFTQLICSLNVHSGFLLTEDVMSWLILVCTS